VYLENEEEKMEAGTGTPLEKKRKLEEGNGTRIAGTYHDRKS